MRTKHLNQRGRAPVVFRLTLLLALVLVPVLGFVQPVQAAEMPPGGVIEAGQVINDDVFISGGDVRMDGTVNGMLFAAGNTVTINGTVNGDVLAVGSQVTIGRTGVVNGNVFTVAGNLVLEGQVLGSYFSGSGGLVVEEGATVGRNLYYGGFGAELKKGSTVGQDVLFGGYQAVLSGSIGRDFRAGAGAVELNGSVGRDLVVDMGEVDLNAPPPTMFFPFPGAPAFPQGIRPGLRVAPTAGIGGRLIYTAGVDMAGAIQAQPSGGLVHQTPVPQVEKPGGLPKPEKTFLGSLLKWFVRVLQNLFTLLILGALALWLVPGLLSRSADQAARKPAPSTGWGIVVVLLGYIAAGVAALVVLLLGILFGVFTLGGLSRSIFGVGFGAVALATAVFSVLVGYASKLVVAFLVGRLIMDRLAPQAKGSRWWAMLIGIVLYVVVGFIPFIGWLVRMLVTILGVGAMWLLYRQWRLEQRPPEAPLAVPAEALPAKPARAARAKPAKPSA